MVVLSASGITSVIRQSSTGKFPVGLFTGEKPSRSSALFPGGKGAIDLVCLDGETLWVFELKAERNIPIGTLTELLFYTAVVGDLIRGEFRSARGVNSGLKIQDEDLAEVNSIRSMMLGHNLHPLVGETALMSLLNEAVSKRWNGPGVRPHVSFGAGLIHWTPGV